MGQIQMSPLGRFERFLLPTDGSEFSRCAEKLAIAMCCLICGRLVVMRAVLRLGNSTSLPILLSAFFFVFMPA